MCIKSHFWEDLNFEGSLENLSKALELFKDFLGHFKITEKDQFLWQLCLSEVLSNAIDHGKGPYRLSWDYRCEAIKIRLVDKGVGPEASLIESPSLPEEIVAQCGRGLFIINNFVDVWLHEKSGEGYLQTLIKFC